jgi:hypothetical protein
VVLVERQAQAAQAYLIQFLDQLYFMQVAVAVALIELQQP